MFSRPLLLPLPRALPRSGTVRCRPIFLPSFLVDPWRDLRVSPCRLFSCFQKKTSVVSTSFALRLRVYRAVVQTEGTPQNGLKENGTKKNRKPFPWLSKSSTNTKHKTRKRARIERERESWNRASRKSLLRQRANDYFHWTPSFFCTWTFDLENPKKKVTFSWHDRF